MQIKATFYFCSERTYRLVGIAGKNVIQCYTTFKSSKLFQRRKKLYWIFLFFFFLFYKALVPHLFPPVLTLWTFINKIDLVSANSIWFNRVRARQSKKVTRAFIEQLNPKNNWSTTFPDSEYKELLHILMNCFPTRSPVKVIQGQIKLKTF